MTNFLCFPSALVAHHGLCEPGKPSELMPVSRLPPDSRVAATLLGCELVGCGLDPSRFAVVREFGTCFSVGLGYMNSLPCARAGFGRC